MVGIPASHPQGQPENLPYRITGPLTQQMSSVTGNLHPAFSRSSLRTGFPACKISVATGISFSSACSCSQVWELCSGSHLGDKASPAYCFHTAPSSLNPALPSTLFPMPFATLAWSRTPVELQGANPRDTKQEGRQVLHAIHPGLGKPSQCRLARESMTQAYLGLLVLRELQ